jgi:hypothetical protein
VPFFSITIIVGFIESVLTFSAGGMTHTHRLVSPVELFFILFDTAVVTFFLSYDFLLMLHLSLTCFSVHVILKSKDLPFFESRSFLVGPAGFEPATKAL